MQILFCKLNWINFCTEIFCYNKCKRITQFNDLDYFTPWKIINAYWYQMLPPRLNPSNGTWFLVETNYDNWQDPPFFDDRRTPATKCMNKMTQAVRNYENDQTNIKRATFFIALFVCMTQGAT